MARVTVSNDTVHRWFNDVLYLTGLGYSNLGMILAVECDWTEKQRGYMQRELRKISDFYIERFRDGNPLYVKHIDDGLKGIINPSRQRYHCGAGVGAVLVKTNGTIYPCHRFGGVIDADSGKHWQLGSIFDGIDQEKRKAFLNFDCVSQTKADCENCLAVHTCGIGCIAVNWSCFHDIYKPHPNYCTFKNMYFIEALRIYYILKNENNQTFTNRFCIHNQSQHERHSIQRKVASGVLI